MLSPRKKSSCLLSETFYWALWPTPQKKHCPSNSSFEISTGRGGFWCQQNTLTLLICQWRTLATSRELHLPQPYQWALFCCAYHQHIFRTSNAKSHWKELDKTSQIRRRWKIFKLVVGDNGWQSCLIPGVISKVHDLASPATVLTMKTFLLKIQHY